MITDFSRIDTTTGSGHPLSAPAIIQDDRAYRLWLKELYETDPGMRQHLYCLARNHAGRIPYAHPVEISGPYAAALSNWLRMVWQAIVDRAEQRALAEQNQPAFALA